MLRRGALLRVFVALGLTALLSTSAAAQPTVTLQVESLDNGQRVLFTFLQSDLASVDGCHYNLFAAATRRALATLPGKGLSIATFFRAETSVQIVAGPLGRLQRHSTTGSSTAALSRTLYFRALVSCPGATNGEGEIVTLAVPTTRNGRVTTVRKLLREMKFHMQYYEGGTGT